MTRQSGYVRFESIVAAAVAILTILTLGLFAQAVLNPTVFI